MGNGADAQRNSGGVAEEQLLQADFVLRLFADLACERWPHVRPVTAYDLRDGRPSDLDPLSEGLVSQAMLFEVFFKRMHSPPWCQTGTMVSNGSSELRDDVPIWHLVGHGQVSEKTG